MTVTGAVGATALPSAARCTSILLLLLRVEAACDVDFEDERSSCRCRERDAVATRPHATRCELRELLARDDAYLIAAKLL